MVHTVQWCSAVQCGVVWCCAVVLGGACVGSSVERSAVEWCMPWCGTCSGAVWYSGIVPCMPWCGSYNDVVHTMMWFIQ